MPDTRTMSRYSRTGTEANFPMKDEATAPNACRRLMIRNDRLFTVRDRVKRDALGGV